MTRAELRALIGSLHPGEALDEFQWLEITKILGAIADGYDVRRDMGIKAKRGAPPSTQEFQKFIVRHVLALHARRPALPEKVAQGMVAAAWGISDNEVSKLARKWRKTLNFNPTVAEFTLESVDTLIAAYKTRTRK